MQEKYEWLISAIALVLIFEGLLPFASPKIWRNNIKKLLLLDDKNLRIVGFWLMVIGTVIIYFIHI